MSKKLNEAELVSIIIPLFNKREYIRRCINSVLAQSYKNFEVIVVNDGSTDFGEQVVHSILDNRIRLVNQANAGVSAARNKGVELANGELVFFLDADDEWKPDLILELLKVKNQHPNAGIVACVTERVYFDGSRTTVRLVDGDFQGDTSYLKNYLATFVRLKQSPFSNSSFAVNKKAFLAVGGYSPGVRLTEDSDIWVRLALNFPVAVSKKPLALYFVEVDQNTRLIGQKEKFEVIKTLEFCLDNGLVPHDWKRSALELIRLQKLMQLRRHVLLDYKLRTLQSIADKDLWIHEFTSCIIILTAVVLPSFIFNSIRQLTRSIRK